MSKKNKQHKKVWHVGTYYANPKPDYDYGELDDFGLGYDYQLDQKINSNSYALKNYKAGGKWGGYGAFKPLSLSYTYIEQVANMLSARYNVTTKAGDNWAVNLKTKELIYNPQTLLTGTKSELLGCLLHEIGHIRHTKFNYEPSEVDKKYPHATKDLLNVLEDLRVDVLMENSYSTSQEIQQENKRVYADLVNQAKEKKENNIRNLRNIIFTLNHFYGEQVDYVEQHKNSELMINGVRVTIDDKLIDFLNLPKAERQAKTQELEKRLTHVNVLDYITAIYCGELGLKIPDNVKTEYEATKDYIKQCRTAPSTAEVHKILCGDIVPRILKLFEDENEVNKTIGAGLGSLLSTGQSDDENPIDISNDAKEGDDRGGGHVPSRVNKQEYVPAEWRQGDYEALHDSVRGAINELTRKLRYIKAKDLSARYQENLKRGKLNPRKFYRLPLNRYDVFKKRVETVDRTQNFAFSLLVDISGSMSSCVDGGSIEKSINSARCAIILAETLKNLDMPFEVLTFGNVTHRYKSFGDKYGIELKKQFVADCVDARDGCNEISTYTPQSELLQRPEQNRYSIIITDGGFGTGRDWSKFQTQSEQWRKRGVKFIGVDLEGYLDRTLKGDEVVKIKNANQLPEIFTGILRDIIKKL